MDEQYRSLDPSQQKEFQQQRYQDLIQRSWPGVMVYPLVWWAVVLPRLWYAPTSENLSWLGGLGFLILLSCSIRIRLLRNFRQRLAESQVRLAWEIYLRSEERRVGKECRSWWAAAHAKKKR